MKTIQLHVPDELAAKMQKLTQNAEKFILDLIKNKVEELDKPISLAEQYRMAAEENKKLNDDFSHVDMEGWDDEY